MLPPRHPRCSLHHLRPHSSSLRHRLFVFLFFVAISSLFLPPSTVASSRAAASSASTFDSDEASIATARQSTTPICATPIYSNSTRAASCSSFLRDPDRRRCFFVHPCPVSSSDDLGRRHFFVRP
ncbi:hypothetical protein PIB30_108171, partial [Stylosanthes scabra]|nr:hypothetical protein [Stylosanthes scabra]